MPPIANYARLRADLAPAIRSQTGKESESRNAPSATSLQLPRRYLVYRCVSSELKFAAGGTSIRERPPSHTCIGRQANPLGSVQVAKNIMLARFRLSSVSQ